MSLPGRDNATCPPIAGPREDREELPEQRFHVRAMEETEAD